MEVDIMAHQEQLPTKFFVLIFLLILWSSCSVPEKTKPIVTVDLYKNLLNKQDQQLTIINGIVMQQNNPFTGTLFTLYPSTKDTAELIGYLNGKEHGEWKKYYASTKLKEKDILIMGLKWVNTLLGGRMGKNKATTFLKQMNTKALVKNGIKMVYYQEY
jgi:antitoxin component YwqK of YwqJK toxin-antitoxin module